MRLVLDTNIFISSFFWNGNPRKIMKRILSGKDKLIVCNEILFEISSVLARPKFNVSENLITFYINSIEEIAYHAVIKGNLQICRDSDDDKILECALLSDADYIIEANKVAKNYVSHFPTLLPSFLLRFS
jgi:putative PIN family toxin of toxin-antitoxin system